MSVNHRWASVDAKGGKNLLIFEVAKRYIYNFLRSEQQLLEKGCKLKILSIESNLKTEIKIPELDFPVYIKGKVDRIDELDGQLRIIDYKTGKENPIYKDQIDNYASAINSIGYDVSKKILVYIDEDITIKEV